MFMNKEDFDVGATHNAIDNWVMATVINAKSLFVGPLKKVTNAGIVTVGGEDYRPSHKEIARLSWKDDKKRHTNIWSEMPYVSLHQW